VLYDCIVPTQSLLKGFAMLRSTLMVINAAENRGVELSRDQLATLQRRFKSDAREAGKRFAAACLSDALDAIERGDAIPAAIVLRGETVRERRADAMQLI